MRNIVLLGVAVCCIAGCSEAPTDPIRPARELQPEWSPYHHQEADCDLLPCPVHTRGASEDWVPVWQDEDTGGFITPDGSIHL